MSNFQANSCNTPSCEHESQCCTGNKHSPPLFSIGCSAWDGILSQVQRRERSCDVAVSQQPPPHLQTPQRRSAVPAMHRACCDHPCCWHYLHQRVQQQLPASCPAAAAAAAVEQRRHQPAPHRRCQVRGAPCRMAMQRAHMRRGVLTDAERVDSSSGTCMCMTRTTTTTGALPGYLWLLGQAAAWCRGGGARRSAASSTPQLLLPLRRLETSLGSGCQLLSARRQISRRWGRGTRHDRAAPHRPHCTASAAAHLLASSPRGDSRRRPTAGTHTHTHTRMLGSRRE